MKRWINIILVVVFSLSLVACNSNSEMQGGTQGQTETNENATTEKMTTEEITLEEISSEGHIFESTASETTEASPQPSSPTVSIEPGTYAYTLIEVGKIKDSDRDIVIGNDALLKMIDKESAEILNYLGEKKNELIISGIEYLGNGAYVVRSTENEINSVGLISQEGEVLIPFEACKIDWPKSSYSETDRFLVVTYVTGETTNKDECFVYATDSWFSWGPEEGDTMYTGYAKVYDLVNKSFVENVLITNGDRYAMQPCGDHFLVTDENGTTVLYNDKGENVFQTTRNVEAGNGIFLVRDDGTYRIYDENGTQTYVSNKGIFLISQSSSGYIYKYENDRSVIMDRYGNQMLGTVVEGVFSEENDVFKVKNNGKYGLIQADGMVICACDKYTSIQYLDAGIYMLSADTGNTYTLMGNNGMIKEGLSSSGIYDLKIKDGNKFLVINEKDFMLTLEDDYPVKLELAMIAARSDSERLYGAFDLFTGEQLLGYEYETIQVAAGYLYAFKNGEWTVFQINGPEN